jgi:hypothetical protein
MEFSESELSSEIEYLLKSDELWRDMVPTVENFLRSRYVVPSSDIEIGHSYQNPCVKKEVSLQYSNGVELMFVADIFSIGEFYIRFGGCALC